MELEVGSVFAGHRLDAVAGRGGMGVVYRATDVLLDRQVALKVIAPALAGEPQFVKRFKQESRVAASINHPHVLPIWRAGEEEGRLFVTMRLVEGRDLGEQLVQEGRFDPPTAARLISQVASALDAAHARGLVHRDVKPGNILLERRPEGLHAYLTDFGLTKMSAPGASALTATGMILGTLDYMAPEQMLGEQLDARTDIYALGCVLFEAVTGRVPYPQKTPVAKMHAHANLPVPSLRELIADLPAGLDAVVARGMAKNRDERYLSAGDLGRAAVAAASGDTPQLAEQSVAAGPATLLSPTVPAQPAPPAPPPPAPPPPRRAAEPPPVAAPVPKRGPRPALPIVVAIVGVLAAGGIAAALLAGGGGDKESAPVGGAATEETSTTSASKSSGTTTSEEDAPSTDGLTFEPRITTIRECLEGQGLTVITDGNTSGYITGSFDNPVGLFLKFEYDQYGLGQEYQADFAREQGYTIYYQDDELIVTFEDAEPDADARVVAETCVAEVT